eukprot:TRINITY_DN651_c0_g2_i3.p2 TRINITY_DN651_c0_g2~~TRINITY_DN651_c0_g2_i3.p2  ORF type:complete len:197 (+),score=28.60 TRINITY_DN651_c0_g2_i3:137-727(+)
MNQLTWIAILSVISTMNSVTGIIGDGSFFSQDRQIAYGDSDDGSVTAGGLLSAFLVGGGDSIFGANVGGISLDRDNSDADVAGANGVSGQAENGVAGYGLLEQLAAVSGSEGLVISQSATGIIGAGNGQVAAADVQEGSVGTPTGSAGFYTAGQASDEGNNPTAQTVAAGLAAQTEDSSVSAAVLCASSGGTLPCK